MHKIFLTAALLAVFSCAENKKEITINQSSATADTIKNTASNDISEEQQLKDLNSKILTILKDGNYAELSRYIHPADGIRFSMYAFVDPTVDKHFSRKEFEKYIDTDVKFTWGNRDGSGEPLILSLRDYLKQWAAAKDYGKGEYYLNEFKGKGNSINNLKKVYPDDPFTENYLSGTEEYGGMDWNSMRMVFRKDNGRYYLVAIVNDRWTV